MTCFECFKTFLACECCSKEKRRTNPLLLIFSGITTLIPLFIGTIIAGLYWQNSCHTLWQAIIISYCILNLMNFIFIWYIHYRLTISIKREKGKCMSATKLLFKDIGVIIFLVLLILELIFNIVLGVIISKDQNCRSKEPNLIGMAQACNIFMYIFIVGVVVLGLLNLMIECCRPQPKQDAEKNNEEETPASKTEEKKGTLTTKQSKQPPPPYGPPLPPKNTTEESNPFDNQPANQHNSSDQTVHHETNPFDQTVHHETNPFDQ